MKDKLTIRSSLAERVREKAPLANVKIISETNVGDDIVMIVSVRSPSFLFNLGRYVYDTSLTVSEVKAKPKKKAA